MRRRILGLVSCLLFLSSPAWADRSADKVCSDLARKAGRTLWSSVRESGDDLFCRKSWVPGLPDELAACGLWTKTNLFGNKLKNFWNAKFAREREWATWGPRGISVDWEAGTIRKGFKRSYFGAGLAYSRSTIEVVKEGGLAEASVTACELDHDGNVVGRQQKTFRSGRGGENTSVKMVFEHKNNRIVGVVVDTPVQLAGRTFEYRARQLTEPIRNNLPAVKGIADLHVHQMVNVTFGGRMYWGHHSGPVETALAREVVNPTGTGFDLSSLDGLLKTIARPGASIDANVVFTIAGGKISDEGFWRYGGGGYPDFKDWPHHADRSHQQVHISWVKEAHERNRDSHSNLQLMVVSLVNNDVLCSVAKMMDPYGNVPLRDDAGKITGWESRGWGCSDHENVTRQLKAMHEIERQHPWYRIAMTPWHARQIIADGDLAVVVAMETDKPLSSEGNNYGNWEHQLDFYRAMGLTTMQIVHESDSKFCGAAPHRDLMGALQLIHWPLKSIDDLFTSKFELDGNKHNRRGITGEGVKLVDAMVKRNMPIDLAHGSQRCREGIMARVGTGYGLYDSHTKFESLLGGHVRAREQEFVITDGILPLYKKHKVLVGLRTASVDVNDAPGSRVANNCPGSARSFAQLVQHADRHGLPFSFGTDFNTGVSQLGPRFGAKDDRCWAARKDLKDVITRHTSADEGPMPARARRIKPIAGTNYYTDGLATIGWLPELTVDLIDGLKTPGARKLRDSAEAYLDMWERTYPPAGKPPAQAPGVSPGSIAMGGSCKRGDECRSGRCTGAAGIAGVCVCNDDPDCGAGRYCNTGPDFKQNKCFDKKDDGETCAIAGGGHQCASGRCKMGVLAVARCYTPNSVPMGGTCHVDDACANGKCSSIGGTQGTCVCDADSDCNAGQWCDRGADTKKNVCRAKLSDGAICGTVGQLGVGHRCKSGSCKMTGPSKNLRCK
jgi:microsomal dipeptidase-like Zn-dependent dipeptidase